MSKDKIKSDLDRTAEEYVSDPKNYMPGFKPMGDVRAAFKSGAEWATDRVSVLIEALQFYAEGNTDLEPKPEKSHLYDQNYEMCSPEWLQRSMSDFVSGNRAREALARFRSIK